jgi:hypothetical protein
VWIGTGAYLSIPRKVARASVSSAKTRILSDGRKKAAAISAHGTMNIATPEAAPNAFALTITLARPVSGRSARPKTGDRREIAGIARKNGVERNVSSVGAICRLTDEYTYRG